MLGTHHLPLFIASGLLLNLAPGADSLYVATRSLAHGFRAGAIAALGIGLGCCVHILAAAAGLSAILATSATAFTIVKLAGAAYLVWMGVALMRSASAPSPAKNAQAIASAREIFSQGFLTDVLNPKVALFFLAFVPQFIAPQAGNKPLAFLFLGGIFALNGTLWCVALAWLSARAGSLKMGRQAVAWLCRGVGAVFVLFGLRLALAGRS